MGEEYSAGQLMRIAAVYEFIAKALPTEGRDYKVEFVFDKNRPENISVKFEGFNEIGKIWCDYCYKMLKSKSSK